MSEQPKWLEALSKDVWDTYKAHQTGQKKLSLLSLQNAIQVVHSMTQQPNIQVELECHPRLVIDSRGRSEISWRDESDQTHYQILCSDRKIDRYWWRQWSSNSNVSLMYPGSYDQIVVYYLCYVLEKKTNRIT